MDPTSDPTSDDDTPDEVREGERPCPVCAVAMRVETKSSVSVDTCSEHGIWLDKGELDKLLLSRSSRQRRRRVRGTERAHRRGVAKGAVLGWGALLLD